MYQVIIIIRKPDTNNIQQQVADAIAEMDSYHRQDILRECECECGSRRKDSDICQRYM